MKLLARKREQTTAAGVSVRAMRLSSSLEALAAAVASSEGSVLIVGEEGTPKDEVAEMVHRLSTRRQQPLLPVACAAWSVNLIEAALLGEVGGEEGPQLGLLELAHGGAVFLSDLQELRPRSQETLLGVLTTGRWSPVGGSRLVEADVRFIASASPSVHEYARQERFSGELLARLSEVVVTIPPLRDRRTEVPDLARAFVAEHAEAEGSSPLAISQDALAAIQGCEWFSNERQLWLALAAAFVRCKGDIIRSEHIDVPGRAN
jgi:two-component system, NtrC family, response regulator AtoC